MNNAYYDPASAGSFGGVKALANVVNENYKATRDWLASQDAYTLHKPVIRKFARRKIFTVGVDHLWQLDLADLSAESRYNDGYKFLLVCIDCFSRYAWVEPIKNKSGISVRDAFAKIIEKDSRKPTYAQTDKGTEFLNSTFQSFLKERGIRFYASENEDIKCAIVERLNRTIKSKMWRYFTHKNTRRYADVLQDLVKSYNFSFHRSIKMRPADVTSHNENIVRRILYGNEPQRTFKYAFQIGDLVRISKGRGAFRKGYDQGWTNELFTVTTRLPTDPPTYEIKDLSGDPIKGRFYAQELQKVVKTDDAYKVEKILKTRKLRGRTQYFVKWLGYPSSFNSWVDNLIA